jgi:aryl-alcohol dehydrogenase-like predicted oxidoreductase
MSAVPLHRLGRSGLTVSRLCLGTMQFGSRMEEADAKRMVAHAADHGVNFIDTADTYVSGKSEEIVGRIIASNRPAWVLATKVATPSPQAGVNRRGLSRKWIIEEVHASLKRLSTDFIDILYLHKEDILTPLEETVRALADLQRSGAIRYFGLSNYRAWRIARVCEICDDMNIDRPVVYQPVYHALNRQIEIEVLPACREYGLGVFPYSPNARGVLSGKYAEGVAPPEGSRAATKADTLKGETRPEALAAANVLYKRMMNSEFQPANLAAAAKIAERAKQRGLDPTAYAIAFVLANPNVTGAIAGPRTLEQWEAYIKAFDVEWTKDDEALVDSLVPPGGTAVPNYQDPMYPIEGRAPVAFGKAASGVIDPSYVPIRG